MNNATNDFNYFSFILILDQTDVLLVYNKLRILMNILKAMFQWLEFVLVKKLLHDKKSTSAGSFKLNFDFGSVSECLFGL